MRVTSKMLTMSLINNINTNLQKLGKYQNQMTSGAIISKPSDNPIAMARLLNTKSALKAREQFVRNMEDAVGWLDTADGALNSANEVLQRARDLAMTGSTATTPDESMAALAAEVNDLVGDLLQIANTNYAGRYIFGGGKSAAAPFAAVTAEGGRITAVEFIGTDFAGLTAGEVSQQLNRIYSREVEIEVGITIDIAAGKMAFHTAADGSGSVNAVFEKLIELRNALDGGDKEAVGSLLGDFDKMIDNMLSERTIVGAKVNRMETALHRSAAMELHLTELMSKLEDADYFAASTAFKTQLAVYEASLATGAKIIQPSLLNFLK